MWLYCLTMMPVAFHFDQSYWIRINPFPCERLQLSLLNASRPDRETIWPGSSERRKMTCSSSPIHIGKRQPALAFGTPSEAWAVRSVAVEVLAASTLTSGYNLYLTCAFICTRAFQQLPVGELAIKIQECILYVEWNGYHSANLFSGT